MKSVPPGAAPATRAAIVGLDIVTDVLLEIKRASRRVDRRELVLTLEEAIKELTTLRGSNVSDADHLTVLDRTTASVVEARRMLEVFSVGEAGRRMEKRILGAQRLLEHVREDTVNAVVGAQQEVMARARRPAVPEPELRFVASAGVPRAHAFERAPLRTNVDTMSPDDFWSDDDDLQDLAAPDDDLDRPPTEALVVDPIETQEIDHEARRPADQVKRLTVLGAADGAEEDPKMLRGLEGELAQLRRLARDCLEEIGAISTLRRLRDHERFRWDVMTRYEARMVACLDALVALAAPFFSGSGPPTPNRGFDVLREVMHYGSDGATIDPGRAFARTFVLCNVAGADTVRAAIVALMQSHRATYDAQIHAFALGDNPEIDLAAKRLTNDPVAGIANVGLQVLVRRGSADFASVASLCEHPSQEVSLNSCHALAAVPDREAAMALLASAYEEAINDDVLLATVEAWLLQETRNREPAKAATARLRTILDDELAEPGMLHVDRRARAMLLLAVAGAAHDAERLSESYFGEVGESLALGFHGHVHHVETLIDALSNTGELVTGPNMRAAAATALVRITGAPFQRRDRYGEVPDPYDVFTDRDDWATWWADNHARFDEGVRYRFGEPYSPLAAAAELERDGVPVRVRRACALELALALGQRPLDLDALAVRQREQIAAQRASIEAASAGGDPRFAPGRWLG